MSIVLVTGAHGLVGSATVALFAEQGYDVIGIDNNMRQYFFGEDGSTLAAGERLRQTYGPRYRALDLDIRDQAAIEALFAEHGKDLAGVVHAAAQPSHDWAAREPLTDFTINANGTLHLLEATRRHAAEVPFIFTSTNKVYGDQPNHLPLIELESRWELDPAHPYALRGVDESMSIDNCLHSLFGASKVAADVLTQEYGRYFGLKTAVFRGGCLTGSGHAGAELHGFLAWLSKCVLSGRPYTVFGYLGKQVRDNIHVRDLVQAFWEFFQAPRSGEVYNMGGARIANCSVLEAIALCEEISGRRLDYSIVPGNRIGDHQWWISDVQKFASHYPRWRLTLSIREIIEEIIAGLRQQSA
ncbi:NAD-dependent epimerase/dehydratase family protein [Candidatus Magnetaquicoccus inordinatus]|uniref:NAD-dependent epimerase/dehydratase family protein n=1 Tax=Candidatus Magnetaquicoccus inordinatus TaxID=2496818 RepID=UPI00102CC973|nr:NAD-dependent epimerase/dehydratase family protein [Candidatus Magnetaquicoccus inordinatus]